MGGFGEKEYITRYIPLECRSGAKDCYYDQSIKKSDEDCTIAQSTKGIDMKSSNNSLDVAVSNH
jgi:hypothetical protein